MSENQAEQYRPSVEEQLNAHENLTPEQRELSDVRQLFLEHEPRIAELPDDFMAIPDIKTYTGGLGSFEYLKRTMSGTFDDRGRIVITQRTFPGITDESDLHWSGKIYSTAEKDAFGSEKEIGKLTPEEAQELFDELYPVAKAFNQMKASEEQIRDKYRHERNVQELQAREAEQEKTLHIEKAKQQAFAEGKTIGRYEGILESKLDGMEISDEDKTFVYDAIADVAMIASGSGTLTLMRDTEGYPRTEDEKLSQRKHREDFARRKDVVRQLLGVVDDPVKWTNLGNFAQSYTEWHTYSTVLPGLVFIVGDGGKDFGVTSNERTVAPHKKEVDARELSKAGKN